MPIEITNPRFYPGNISGSGMQHTETGRTVDTRYGMRISQTDTCVIEHPHQGSLTIACTMSGNVEDSGDRIRALYLLDPDTTAHLITQLTAVLGRVNPEVAHQFINNLHDAYPSPTPVAVVDLDLSAPAPQAAADDGDVLAPEQSTDAEPVEDGGRTADAA